MKVAPPASARGPPLAPPTANTARGGTSPHHSDGGGSSAPPPSGAQHPPNHLHANAAAFNAHHAAYLHAAHIINDPDAAVHAQWSAVSTTTVSALLTAFAAFVLYCCYTLMAPYLSGILWGVLLSIIFHPSTEVWLESAERRKSRNLRCLERLVGGYERHEARLMAMPWYRRFPLRQWLRLASTWSFYRYYLFEIGDFLGIDKLPIVVEAPDARRSARRQRLIAYATVTLFMVTLSGVAAVVAVQCVIVVVVSALRLLCGAERFLSYASRACDAIATITFAMLLAVGFATDVRDVSNTVTSATEMLIDNAGVDAHVVEDFIADLQERFLEDIASGFNSSNVTKAAMDIRRR